MNSGKLLCFAFIGFVNHLYWRFAVIPYYRDYVRLRTIRRKGIRTKGIIVGHVEWEDDDELIQFAPVIKFTAEDGTGYTIESGAFSVRKKTVGDRLSVAYYADDPSGAIINPALETRFAFFKVFTLIVVFTLVSLMAAVGVWFDLIH
ncbi:DUF3592 domain-containing protein [Paraflavitalea pollutisoli]|uniref:DUF3592 domain-containing protein n=1 Tax=Paraflavitalea pollutisoli TaxID=3034143 RepID=UPI0023EBFCAD|nr:DUF3592 domain-containing protein [Paraflavitalea sp. H1-2-19X]